MKKIEYNYCIYNQTRLYFSSDEIHMDLHFKCDKCSTTKMLDLKKAVTGNCYVHCNKCDIYYKLTYDSLNTSNLKFYLKEIPKRDAMEGMMFTKNGYGYTVFEVE